ncbi:MAG: hypothetical protein IT349_14175 [Candidatus Eisenbacteria bacterium]|nr:hypothetical protein [Candidatus Eisenbacteria bacterium]MCC7143242.1 hypothetical protein [Candidatus Eisenbacteria bacterium]
MSPARCLDLRRRVAAVGLLCLAPALGAGAGSASASAFPPSAEPGDVQPTRTRSGLIALAPRLADAPYRLSPGARPYRDRLVLSPAYGRFGSSELFSLRAAFNPNAVLGYEAGLGHLPGRSAHSLLHTLSIQIRRPFSGRFQPYAVLGYGMILIFPSQAENADSVTRNLLRGGVGLELFVRDDLALRGEWLRATVSGGGRLGTDAVSYQYAEGTVGLSFHRRIGG